MTHQLKYFENFDELDVTFKISKEECRALHDLLSQYLYRASGGFVPEDMKDRWRLEYIFNRVTSALINKEIDNNVEQKLERKMEQDNVLEQ